MQGSAFRAWSISPLLRKNNLGSGPEEDGSINSLSHLLHTHFITHCPRARVHITLNNPEALTALPISSQHKTQPAMAPQLSPMVTSMRRLPRGLSLNNYSCSILEWMQALAAKPCSLSPLPRRDNVGIDQEEDEAQTLTSHPSSAHFTCATRVHITLNTQLNPEAPSSSHHRTLPERTLLLGKWMSTKKTM